MSDYPVQKQSLHKPSLEEASKILLKGLKSNFAEVSSEVVQCPDLSKQPYGLAAKGLCGSPRVGEIGGVRYLVPLARKEKVYDLQDIAKCAELPTGLVIGAGAGPLPFVGTNSEIIANLTPQSNENRVATVGDDQKCVLQRAPLEETRCSLMLNFYACEGNTGPVIKVKAKKRTGKMDFVGCMRKALEEHYGSKTVGVGGTFLMKSGTAKMHIMPAFSEVPLKSEQEVGRWLKFYDMKSPIVFMSIFISKDPGMDFREEHTHGYSATEGGHYHYDTTPEEVEYEGYFNLADVIYRIDKP